MSGLFKIFIDEQGNSLILVTISLTLFLALSAVVVDLGLSMLEQENLQQGLDAAVLAGTRELVENPAEALTVAENYLMKNINTVSSYQITKNAFGQGLDAKGLQKVNYFFAPIIGFIKGNVGAKSSARVSNISAVQGAAPLAVEEHNFLSDTPYVLRQSPNGFSFSNYLGPGNFGAISLGQSGSSTYEENLKYGYSGLLTIGSIVETETGNMAGPTKRGVDYVLSQCDSSPQCTPENFEPGCPRVLLIPVYKDLGYVSSQVKQIEIVGFAAFMVTETSGGGINSEITGYFVKTVTVGIPSDAAPDFGLHTLRLVNGEGQ